MYRKTKKVAPSQRELRHPIWDQFIAPGITTLKKQKLKTVPRELRPDPLQFVITAILFPGIDVKTRVRVFTFIRRTQTVYDSYQSARLAYAKFFREQDHHAYLRALNQFEICLAAAYQGHEVLFALRNSEFRDKSGGGRAELNWRMDRLYNKSKHTEGMIRSQSFKGSTVAMWLSNEGVRTQTETIEFDELHEIVFDMSLIGSVLAKSHLWRKQMPPLLEKYAGRVASIQAKSRSKKQVAHMSTGEMPDKRREAGKPEPKA
jgi:hypothetical protein